MVGKRGSRKEVLKYLREHDYLTSMEAFEKWGITRLSAIIHDFRKAGYDIDTVLIQSTTRFGETTQYGRYILKGEPK